MPCAAPFRTAKHPLNIRVGILTRARPCLRLNSRIKNVPSGLRGPHPRKGIANMAKHHKWNGKVLSYTVPGAGEGGQSAEATLDVDKLPDAVKEAAMLFGIQTAARNSTAGLFSDEPTTAFKRMTARFKNWLDGQWKAASAGEGERKTSMLSQAVAEAGQIEVDQAADIITSMIEEKVTEAGLSADEEADKPAIRKIGAAVRSGFAELPEVAPILARIKAEAALQRQKEATEAAEVAKKEGKVGSLAEMLKK
jgi:hypothetical protein